MDVGLYFRTAAGLAFKPLSSQSLKIGSSATSDLRESSLPGFAATLSSNADGTCTLILLDQLAAITIDGVPASGRTAVEVGCKLRLGSSFLILGLAADQIVTVDAPLDAESRAEPYVPPFALVAPFATLADSPRRKNIVIPVIAAMLVAMVCLGFFGALKWKRGADQVASGGSVSRTNQTLAPSQEEMCLNCNGTGRVVCPTCGGRGTVGGGQIVYIGQQRLTLDGAKCKACGANGWIQCPMCGGSGKFSQQYRPQQQVQPSDFQDQILQSRHDQASRQTTPQSNKIRDCSEIEAEIAKLLAEIEELKNTPTNSEDEKFWSGAGNGEYSVAAKIRRRVASLEEARNKLAACKSGN